MPLVRATVPAAGMFNALIKTKADGNVLDAFLGETMDGDRLPARKVCSSTRKTHSWIEREAAEFGLTVE